MLFPTVFNRRGDKIRTHLGTENTDKMEVLRVSGIVLPKSYQFLRKRQRKRQKYGLFPVFSFTRGRGKFAPKSLVIETI